MTPERFRRLREILDQRQPDLTVLMENTHKTHNIAAILRSCDATGVFEANAVSDTGDMPRHHKTSAGTRKWVRMRFHAGVGPAIEELRDRGFRVLAAHVGPGARDYRKLDYTRPSAILLGSELYGVSHEAAALADECVFVPMQGMVESLNVSVAAALLLFEARRQREAAGLYDAGPRLEPAVYQRTLFEWAHPEIAARCASLGLPYPAMTDDGDLAENPFSRPD